jgi:hypothetical protein
LRTKFRLIAALIAIVALAALVSAPAASANAGGKKFKTLRIIAEEKQSEFLDLGTRDPRSGMSSCSRIGCSSAAGKWVRAAWCAS